MPYSIHNQILNYQIGPFFNTDIVAMSTSFIINPSCWGWAMRLRAEMDSTNFFTQHYILGLSDLLHCWDSAIIESIDWKQLAVGEWRPPQIWFAIENTILDNRPNFICKIETFISWNLPLCRPHWLISLTWRRRTRLRTANVYSNVYKSPNTYADWTLFAPGTCTLVNPILFYP